MIQPGEQAPDFTLDSTTGSFTLSSLRGQKHAVLIFYPRDNTPGWNRQLSAARDAAAEYSQVDAQVIGVNPGSLASHTKWSEQFNFGFPIVVDTDKKVAAAYGVLKPIGGIQRTVVVIDKAGRVARVKEGMPSTEEIIAAIKVLHKDDPDNTRLSSS